jgi:tRNA threonylcarbamoyladenosine biosynthesis protein TsaB
LDEFLVLGIETSDILCSVAWWEHETVLLEYNVAMPNNHTAVLSDLIGQGFAKIGRTPQDISLVSITSGPGSFTGLRIGMSYAKGLCFALQKPIMAVSNFEILATQVPENKLPLYTMINARRGRAYLGVFKHDKSVLSEKVVKKMSEIAAYLIPRSIVIMHENFSSEDVVVLRNSEFDVRNGKFSAATLCHLGYKKYITGKRIDLPTLEPMYIQPFAGVA